MALSKCGAQSIQALNDLTNKSAVLCNTNFQLAYLEVSRATKWNCLMTPAILPEIPQTPLPGASTPSPTVAWAPLTSYPTICTYISFGGAIYQTVTVYVSSNNFYTDLTTGALVQADYPAFNAFASFGCGGGSAYPSGWAHQYQLPNDFVLLAVLNDNDCWGGTGQGSQYQIMGSSIFTNASQAVIQYVKNVVDTTQFDPLFVGCFVANLAAKIVTSLRLDSGSMSAGFMAEYQRLLSHAMTKDGGEQQARRFNPIPSSNFVRSRYWTTNG